jgi:hypothetical protein
MDGLKLFWLLKSDSEGWLRLGGHFGDGGVAPASESSGYLRHSEDSKLSTTLDVDGLVLILGEQVLDQSDVEGCLVPLAHQNEVSKGSSSLSDLLVRNGILNLDVLNLV